VVWPSVAEDLGRSVAELGYVTFAYSGAYVVSTLLAGRLGRRASIGRLLLLAAAVSVVGLTSLSAATAWPVYLIAAAALGLSGGLIDAATNTYVAIRRGPSSMGFLHGAFGVGAIVGPLIVGVLLWAGVSWRVAFAALAGAELIYVLGLWSFARTIDVPAPTESHESLAAASLRSWTLSWSVLVFFVYAGIAVGVGAWAFTLLTEGRGMSETAGALVVSGYWAAFTASRFLLGIVGNRFPPDRVLRWSAPAITFGLAVFWWNPTVQVGVAAIIFTGFAHGPVFPLQVVLTPRRFGVALTATVIGFEIAAANVGGAVLPGLYGVLAGIAGLEVIPPLFFVNALVLWGCIETLGLVSRDDIARVAAAKV